MNIKINITKATNSKSGWVYCISSPTFKGLYVISSTNEPNMYTDITKRYPDNIKVEFAKFVDDYKKKERSIYSELTDYQSQSNKKFFDISMERIKILFDSLDGEYYDDNFLIDRNHTPKEEHSGQVIEHSGTMRCIEKMKFKIRRIEDGKLKDIWKYYEDVKDHNIFIDYIKKNHRLHGIKDYEKSVKMSIEV
jgi:hypothetical protein